MENDHTVTHVEQEPGTQPGNWVFPFPHFSRIANIGCRDSSHPK